MLDLDALEQHVQAEMQTHHVPGLALAIIRDHELMYARGFGVTSVETGQPVTPDTLFRIGSITKSMTATAVMRLVETGKLDLDRPVRDYVPGLRFSDEGAADQVTLRRLLSHSAGLPTDHSPTGPRDPEALAARLPGKIAGYRFVAPPGKLYCYANPGVRLAGLAAEVVAGRRYTQLMDELVFKPLEMERTTFNTTVAMTYPLAQSHDLEDGAPRVRHRYADDSSTYPSGMAISTVLDLAHFVQMQMGCGRFRGRQVLAPESVAEMQTAQVDRFTTTNGGYGLGLFVDTYKGLRRVYHDGTISTFRSLMAFIPEAGAAAILVANRFGSFYPSMEAIADRVLSGLLGLPDRAAEPAGVEPDRSAWPRFTGSYLGAWVGTATVRADSGRLFLDWNGLPVPLQAHTDRVYFGRRPGDRELINVGFVPEGQAPVRYIQINSSPAERFEPEPGLVPTPGAYATYAGRYTGVEDLTVRVENGQLMIFSAEEGREAACVQIGPRQFACELGVVDFQVAPDGSVPELTFGRMFTLKRRP